MRILTYLLLLLIGYGVGVAVDPPDGRVPVRVWVTNPGARPRCHTEVVVACGVKG